MKMPWTWEDLKNYAPPGRHMPITFEQFRELSDVILNCSWQQWEVRNWNNHSISFSYLEAGDESNRKYFDLRVWPIIKEFRGFQVNEELHAYTFMIETTPWLPAFESFEALLDSLR
jgi:hypothetical protein